MADMSRLRFGASAPNAASPKVPLARISELYDDDFTLPSGDRNHNNVSPVGNNLDEPIDDKHAPDTTLNQSPKQTYLTSDGVALVPRREGDTGFNPVYPVNIAYFGAAAFFLLFMNVSGLSLLSFPVVGNLLREQYQNTHFPYGIIALQFMWCGHYIRRFAEVMFVHIYRRRMPFFESIGASIYYWMFGIWVGWSVNIYMGYIVPDLYFFVPGVLCFLVGEAGNAYCHWILRRLRLQPSGHTTLSARKRAVPTGFLFDYVSYPHYFFEILSWVGFYLASHTMAAGFFLVASALTVIIRAVQGHRQCKKEFNGVDGTPMYPTKRKAIIPFVL